MSQEENQGYETPRGEMLNDSEEDAEYTQSSQSQESWESTQDTTVDEDHVDTNSQSPIVGATAEEPYASALTTTNQQRLEFIWTSVNQFDKEVQGPGGAHLIKAISILYGITESKLEILMFWIHERSKTRFWLGIKDLWEEAREANVLCVD